MLNTKNKGKKYFLVKQFDLIKFNPIDYERNIMPIIINYL